ncbi:MAG: hypothetical protein QM831_32420 [Kofleriaceae bacterium]
MIALLWGCSSHNDPPVITPGNANDAGVDAAPCGLVTCASTGATCGPVGDGCGLVIDCGDCTGGEFCGGDGSAFQCGGTACAPHGCGSAECGVVADGCGGVTASCGTCPTGQICGANDVPNMCGVPACTGLCAQQNACTNQAKTTITGKITAPGHDDTVTWGTPDPIYGALVYVPNGGAAPYYGTTPFAAGVSCDSCSSLVSGEPLVYATTAVDGTFTIDNAPCGASIPLVIQLGRWRRQISIPNVQCCANTALTAAQTHLPRTHTGEPGDLRSDIPLTAVATGDVDALHCVLRKMGVADSEFTTPASGGRVQFYQDNGAVIGTTTPPASSLVATEATLDRYDLVLFECVGERDEKSTTQITHVQDFANAGGRVFATHFSYVWLYDQKPWSQSATWNPDQAASTSMTAIVDTSLQADAATQTRRKAFAQWLQLVGAGATLGQFPIDAIRHDFDAVSTIHATEANTPAQLWLATSDNQPLHYTFDTPVAYPPQQLPTKQCGRVLYSDFHVTDAQTNSAIFPSECAAAPLTPQEKALEFMMFDLASCLGPQFEACVPKTCDQLGIGCGESGDGCDDGAVLNCGGCSNGRVCGQGGPNQCGTGACIPRTCADAMATCGYLGDGCGGIVDCGECPDGTACGGDSVPNQCGTIIK